MAWSKATRISIMLAIDLAFFFLELGTGIYVGSLALMADAFHMLNDVISLVIGLWAVRVSQNKSTDKFSYGWLRAEILGAFFNAVFLIALCVSIVLEALTRFLDPPVIQNPFLILVVGSLGLASNLVGFFVLGGHSHGHGGGDHDHEHDHGQAKGHDHAHIHSDQAHSHGRDAGRDAEEGVARYVSFSNGDTRERCGSGASALSKNQHRRRGSSIRHSRFTNIDDLSIHPASFRQEIIAASRPQNQTDEESASDQSRDPSPSRDDDDLPNETTPLIVPGASATAAINIAPKDGSGSLTLAARRPRRDSCDHAGHNHNKPMESRGGHGHGHNHADMGMRGMILHVIGDALGNVGVIITALVIWKTSWEGRFYADPAVSLFITLIILRSCIPLTLATAKILLQATPDHLSIPDIKADIQDLPGVVSCHHVHIWQLSDTKLVASMHIQVAFPISEENGEKYMKLAMRARSCLHAYGIHSATIQPEFCLDRDHAHLDDSHNHHNKQQQQQQRAADGVSEAATACGTSGPGSICLLECVDDCVGQGCCPDSPKSPPGSSHSHNPQAGGGGGSGHDHGAHSH